MCTVILQNTFNDKNHSSAMRFLWFIKLVLCNVFHIMMTQARNSCLVYLPQKYSTFIEASVVSRTLFKCSTTTTKFIKVQTPLYISDMERYITSNTNSTHISFLSSLIAVPIKSIAEKMQVDLMEFSVDHSKKTHTGRSNLHLCNQNYGKVFELVSRTIYYGNIIIISSIETCYNKLSSILYQSMLRRKDGTKPFVLTTHTLPTKIDVKSILQSIYKIKLTDVSIIVFLTETYYADAFWQTSERFGLNRYDHLWITFETANRLHYSSYLPWKLIDIQADSANQSAINEVTELERILSIVNSNLHESISKIKAAVNNSIQGSMSIYARELSKTTQLQMLKIFSYNKNDNLEMLSNAKLMSQLINIPDFKIKLKIVTIIEAPFTMYARHLYNAHAELKCKSGAVVCKEAVKGILQENKNKWLPTCCIGMIIDLLMLTSIDLHFEFDVYIVEDGFYGGLIPVNNSYQWNGLVNDIYLKRADIAMAAITPTTNRTKYIDFSVPYMRTNILLIASTIAPPINFINWDFITPLESNLRIWLFATFVIGTILIYILENQVLVLRRITDKTAHARYQWREGFSYFSGLTFQRDLGGKNPEKAGARVTAVAFAFGMVIIMTTYTAVLTASKVKSENSNLFVGMNDPKITNPSNGFPYSTVLYSSMMTMFQHSHNPVYRSMYTFMTKFKINTTAEGVELVKQKILGAFISEESFLVYQRSTNCSLKIYGEPIQESGYALMVPKGSPWKELLSKSILKFKKDEILSNIEKKWFPPVCTQNSTSIDTYESAELNYFGGLFLVLCSFSVISFALLGVEYFCYRHHRRVINPIQDKVQVWRESKAGLRRNALIDPVDLSILQTKLKNNVIEPSSDCDSVISETEEQLIRMRIAGRRRMSLANNHNPSIQSETLSLATTTSSIGSNAAFYANVFMKHRKKPPHNSIEVNNKTIKTLMTTLEVIEAELSSKHSEDETDYLDAKPQNENKFNGGHNEVLQLSDVIQVPAGKIKNKKYGQEIDLNQENVTENENNASYDEFLEEIETLSNSNGFSSNLKSLTDEEAYKIIENLDSEFKDSPKNIDSRIIKYLNENEKQEVSSVNEIGEK